MSTSSQDFPSDFRFDVENLSAEERYRQFKICYRQRLPHAAAHMVRNRRGGDRPVEFEWHGDGEDGQRLTEFMKMIAEIDPLRFPLSDTLALVGLAAQFVQGHERTHGAKIVEVALRRPSWGLEALSRYPKLFKSARMDREAHTNALWMMPYQRGKVSSGFELLTVEFVEQMVRSLKALGLRDVPGPDGRTPLMNALAYTLPGSANVVVMADGFMQAYGKDCVAALRYDSKGTGILHKRAGSSTDDGNAAEKAVSKLLDLGLDPLQRTNDGETPLELAARVGKVGVVARLLAACEHPRMDLLKASRIAKIQAGSFDSILSRNMTANGETLRNRLLEITAILGSALARKEMREVLRQPIDAMSVRALNP